jgi:hypothetical protein
MAQLVMTLEGKYAKKLSMIKDANESKYDFHRRVWKEMEEKDRGSAIRRSLRANGVSRKDATAYVKYLQGPSLSHKRVGDINRTKERVRHVIPNMGVVKAGCFVGALGMLSSVASAADALEEPACVRMREAMRKFLETGDCLVITSAHSDVSTCAQKLAQETGQSAFLAISAEWDKMGEECDKRKQAALSCTPVGE